MDEQQLMDVATDGGRDYVYLKPGYASLNGEFSLEQLEAVIELLKRAQA